MRAAVTVAAGLVAAAAVAGCDGQQHGDPSARVWTWASSTQVGQSIGTLQADTHTIDAALADHQEVNVLHTLCGALDVDASTAEGNLPAPDSQLTSTLDDAYRSDAAAAGDCYQGAAGNAALMARSATERARADALLSSAVQRIAESPLAEVVVTDSIPLSDLAKACPKIKQLSIARLLGEAIKRIHSSDSVSSLFA